MNRDVENVETLLHFTSAAFTFPRNRIENAVQVVDYRQRLLDVEFQRLHAGKSNTRIIFEAEERLSEAKQNALDSRVRHREAEMQFALVSGAQSIIARTFGEMCRLSGYTARRLVSRLVCRVSRGVRRPERTSSATRKLRRYTIP